jgi:hypothetical protein
MMANRITICYKLYHFNKVTNMGTVPNTKQSILNRLNTVIHTGQNLYTYMTGTVAGKSADTSSQY